MKILIAIISCHKHGARNQVQREAWVSNVQGADVRFFIGEPVSANPLPDEVYLSVEDDYEHLPDKTRAAVKWALANRYDKVCKIDSDIVKFFPDRLLANVPEQDYVGFVNNSVIPYCSGFAYVLSERSMKVLADADIPEVETAEDRWVGTTLGKHGIRPFRDERFVYFKPPVWQITCPRESIIAFCDCSKS